MQPRDSFIVEVHQAALRDKKIMFLSADFGAPALDKFREECPSQFVHCGISEQNMINVAVGMALAGLRVYCYAMSPFFLRCFEQLKLAGMHGVPITILSAGPGLAYAGAGPTHYATEDIACYRTLVNTDIYTASTAHLASSIAKHTLDSSRMNIVRLERGELPEIYLSNYKCKSGYQTHPRATQDAPYLTCGYLVHWLRARGHSVIDVFRIAPISPLLIMELDKYDHVYTFEEQYGPGGFGEAIQSALAENGKKVRVFRRTLKHQAIYENGTRDQLLEGMWT